VRESKRETIVIVHGTFAAKADGTTQWYEFIGGGDSSSAFIAELDAALQARKSPARCWKHCVEGFEPFSWSGKNDWVDRSWAASRLADYVNELQGLGWTVHIVAHSHGGNVALDALPSLNGGTVSGLSGRLITLGTPFIDASKPIAEEFSWRRRLYRIVTTLSAPIIVLLGILLLWAQHPGITSVTELVASDPLGAAVIGGLAAFIVWVLVRNRSRRDWLAYWTRLSMDRGQPPFALVMSSRMDEPRVLFDRIIGWDNPFDPQIGLFKYCRLSCKVYLKKRRQIEWLHGLALLRNQPRVVQASVIATYAIALLLFARVPRLFLSHEWSTSVIAIAYAILGTLTSAALGSVMYGTSFYSALWAPFRWIARYARGFVAVVRYSLPEYVIRRLAWNYLRVLAMGFEGFWHDRPEVTQKPTRLPNHCYRYDEIQGVELDKAISRRSDSVAASVKQAFDVLADRKVASSGIPGLLATIARDIALVHATYYTSDASIARMADWIAAEAPDPALPVAPPPAPTSASA
jgi:hypothetical protein